MRAKESFRTNIGFVPGTEAGPLKSQFDQLKGRYTELRDQFKATGIEEKQTRESLLAGANRAGAADAEFGGGAAGAAGGSKNMAGLRRAKDTEMQNERDLEQGLRTMREANETQRATNEKLEE